MLNSSDNCSGVDLGGLGRIDAVNGAIITEWGGCVNLAPVAARRYGEAIRVPTRNV